MPPDLAPIVLFVYNRPWHTRQTVAALLRCELAEKSCLYVFSDGPKSVADAPKVAEVRAFVSGIKGFKRVEIHEQPTNLGLARSVIQGVSRVIAQYGKAIVLEDDMVCTRNFLVFMNACLQFYESTPRVFSVSGYSYPLRVPDDFPDDVYLLPRASSWGWGTWLDRWEKADWQVSDYATFVTDRDARKTFAAGGEDLVYMLIKQQKGLINSWAVRWSYAHYKYHAYCLFPVKSKIQNIGNDKSGTHSPHTSRFNTHLSEAAFTLPSDPRVHPQIVKGLQSFFKPSPIRKIINYITLS